MADDTHTRDLDTLAIEVVDWHELHGQMVEAMNAAGNYEATVWDPLDRAFSAKWPKWPLDLISRPAANEWRRDSGYDAATQEYEKLVNRAGDLEHELMRRPAPDSKALLWKLDKLFELDGDGM